MPNDAKTDNLDPRYDGPFSVVFAEPPNVTIDVGGGETKIVHQDRCKVIPFQTISQSQTCGDNDDSDCPILPTDKPRDSVGGDRDEATEESGARGPYPVVSGVYQTGLTPRISRYGRVIKKPLRFRKTTDSEPV